MQTRQGTSAVGRSTRPDDVTPDELRRARGFRRLGIGALTLFVLASQVRLTQQADARTHLDLQVNLLSEQEMTVVLRMLAELCEHFKLTRTTRSHEFASLIKETDVMAVAERVAQDIAGSDAPPCPN